jgi:hypothetical protein
MSYSIPDGLFANRLQSIQQTNNILTSYPLCYAINDRLTGGVYYKTANISRRKLQFIVYGYRRHVTRAKQQILFCIGSAIPQLLGNALKIALIP